MNKISTRQLCFFLAAIAPVGKIVLMPTNLIYFSKNNLLFPAAMNFLLQAAVIFLVLLIAKNDKSFYQLIADKLGNVTAKIILTVFALFFFFFLHRSCRCWNRKFSYRVVFTIRCLRFCRFHPSLYSPHICAPSPSLPSDARGTFWRLFRSPPFSELFSFPSVPPTSARLPLHFNRARDRSSAVSPITWAGFLIPRSSFPSSERSTIKKVSPGKDSFLIWRARRRYYSFWRSFTAYFKVLRSIRNLRLPKPPNTSRELIRSEGSTFCLSIPSRSLWHSTRSCPCKRESTFCGKHTEAGKNASFPRSFRLQSTPYCSCSLSFSTSAIFR